MNNVDARDQVIETGIRLPLFDYVSNAPTSTTDVYTFKVGGSGGLTVCVVSIVYTDDTKGTLSTVTRTPRLV